MNAPTRVLLWLGGAAVLLGVVFALVTWRMGQTEPFGGEGYGVATVIGIVVASLGVLALIGGGVAAAVTSSDSRKSH